MPSWLSKASGAISGQRAEEPHPFEVQCVCGLRHSGLRRRREQRIVCRSCGASLFILPRNSYPVPKPRPVRKKRRRARKRTQAEVEPAQVVRRAAAGVAATAAQVGAGTTQLGARVGAGAVGTAKAVRRFWTPLRLIALGILIILCATFVWSLQSDKREQAIRDLKLADEAAREALDDDNVESAHRHLSTALAALDELKRYDDPLAQDLRQLHRELTAIHHIATASPLEIAADAERISSESPDQWDSRFRVRHRSRWIVIDGPFRRVGTVGGQGRYEVDLPFRLSKSNHAVRVSGVLPALDPLALNDQSHNVVMAAQLERCEFSQVDRAWEIELSPETAFLWSNLDTYTRLGFTLEDEETGDRVRKTLAQQSRALRGHAVADKLKEKVREREAT